MAGGSVLQQAEVKLEGLVLLVELRYALTYCISSVNICIRPCVEY
jgi:hypothetical protein